MPELRPDGGAAHVTVRNTTRTSLNFRVPGQSLHLAPGQNHELPKAYLETPELKVLCQQGAVVELEAESALTAPPPAEGSVGAEGSEGAEEAEEHGRFGSPEGVARRPTSRRK